MKNLFKIFLPVFCLLSFSAEGQKGYGVVIKNDSTSKVPVKMPSDYFNSIEQSLNESTILKENGKVKTKTGFIFGSPGHVMAEGRVNEGLYSNSGIFIYPSAYVFDGTSTIAANGASAPAIGTTMGAAPYVDPGTAKIFKGWMVWCSDAIFLRIKVENAINLASSRFPFGTPIITTPNQTIFVPMIDMVARENWRLTLEYRGSVTALGNGGKFLLVTCPIYETISSDMNFEADGVFFADGDSITYGTLATVGLNTFTGRQIYVGVVRDGLNRVNGKSLRLVNRAVGGWSTTELDIATQRKEFIYNNASLILCNIGMNDSPGYVVGNHDAIYARYMRILDVYREASPTVPIILCKPTKRQNATEDALLASIRTIIQEVATARNDPNMKVIDLSDSSIWPDTNNSRYNQTDGSTTAGNFIHPSISQHLIIGNYILAQLRADPTFMAKIHFGLNQYYLLSLLLILARQRNRRVLFK